MTLTVRRPDLLVVLLGVGSGSCCTCHKSTHTMVVEALTSVGTEGFSHQNILLLLLHPQNLRFAHTAATISHPTMHHQPHRTA